jgi:hypothetical protein
VTNTFNEPGYELNDLGSTFNTLGATPVPLGNSTNLRADVRPGGAWTNITGDVYTAEGVHIKRGRPDEATSVTAASLDMTLNNRTGKYTPGNPVGAFYPNLTKSTPVRVGMGTPPNGGGTDFATAVTSLPDPAITAETSGYLVSAWAQQAASSTFTYPAGYSGGTAVFGTYSKLGSAAKAVSAGSVGGDALTSSVSSVGASVSVFVPGGSSVSNLINNGGSVQSGYVSSYSTYASASQSVSYAAGDTLVVFLEVSDDSGFQQVLGPGDDLVGCEWVLVADSGGGPGPRIQAWTRYCAAAGSTRLYWTPTQYGFQDVLMQVWKVTGSTQWNARFTGTLAQLATTADLSGNDVRCTVQGGSVVRQLGQGQPPAYSPIYRFYTSAARSSLVGGSSPTGLLAYWPLESGTSGNGFSSPIPGVQPAGSAGSVTLGQDSSVVGSADLPQVAKGGYITCPVPAGYATGTNVAGQMAGVFKCYNTALTTTQPLATFMYAQIAGGSSVAYVAVQGFGTGDVQVNLMNSAFSVLATTTAPFYDVVAVSDPTKAPSFGVLVSWQPDVGNSANTNLTLTVSQPSGAVVSLHSTLTGITVGPVAQLVCGRDPTGVEYFTTPLTVGHVYFGTNTNFGNFSSTGLGFPEVSNVFPGPLAHGGPFSAWAGETPFQRITRICQEQRVPLQIGPTVWNPTNVFCGPQENDTTVNLLQTLATTDGGELAEARGFAGLTYRQVRSMAPQPSQLTMDYAAKMITAPFEQYDDDQLTVNDVTATSAGGGTARAYLATGPLSTTAIGTFTGSPQVNVQNEARDLPQVASWYLGQGTTPAPRFKAVTAKLGAVGTSVDSISGLDIGQRFTLANTPAWVTPTGLDQVILGTDEVIGDVPSADWTITLNTVPYDPYTVAVVGGTSQTAALDSGSSKVTSNITSTATSMSVTTTNVGDLWGAANVPFDVVVAGERMTVTAISGSTSPQTFTVTRSVNGVVKAQTAGSAVDVFFQSNLGLNGG